jgi:hypothetical protein
MGWEVSKLFECESVDQVLNTFNTECRVPVKCEYTSERCQSFLTFGFGQLRV